MNTVKIQAEINAIMKTIQDTKVEFNEKRKKKIENGGGTSL